EDIAVLHALGQSSAQGETLDLLGNGFGIVARARSEDHGATHPDGRTAAAHTSATGALLLPELFAAARDFAAVLRAGRARAAVGPISDDGIVQRLAALPWFFHQVKLGLLGCLDGQYVS